MHRLLDAFHMCVNGEGNAILKVHRPGGADTHHWRRLLLQMYTAKTPMPQRRTRFGAAVFNNQIWVVGGYDNVAGTGEGPDTAVLDE